MAEMPIQLAKNRAWPLLQRWNAVYNLTAVRNPNDMLVQHLFDCLAVIEPLRREFGESGRVLDVGSGGGLPGIVIAALCPNIDVVCVDTVGKKAAFIRQAAGELQLPNLSAEHARVEALAAPPFDIVTISIQIGKTTETPASASVPRKPT